MNSTTPEKKAFEGDFAHLAKQVFLPPRIQGLRVCPRSPNSVHARWTDSTQSSPFVFSFLPCLFGYVVRSGVRSKPCQADRLVSHEPSNRSFVQNPHHLATVAHFPVHQPRTDCSQSFLTQWLQKNVRIHSLSHHVRWRWPSPRRDQNLCPHSAVMKTALGHLVSGSSSTPGEFFLGLCYERRQLPDIYC